MERLQDKQKRNVRGARLTEIDFNYLTYNERLLTDGKRAYFCHFCGCGFLDKDKISKHLAPCAVRQLGKNIKFTPKRQSHWRCAACGYIHKEEWDAQNCCEPEEQTAFICPFCEAEFESENAAIECCSFKRE